MERSKLGLVETADEVLFSVDSVVMLGQMTDLSTEGCRIVYDGKGDMTGSPVEVTLIQGVTVGGTVAWQWDGCIGVDFSAPLSAATVKYFRLGEPARKETSEAAGSFGHQLPPLPFEWLRRFALR